MKDEIGRLIRSLQSRFASPRTLASLPSIEEMTRQVELGRCLYDGYLRATEVKYGSLGAQVKRDPVYRKARSMSRLPDVRSMVDEDRLINLFLIIKFFLRDLASRNILEFGAFRGGSSIFMATLLKEYYPEARIIALDTFAGIPASKPGVDLPPQNFLSPNLERIRRTAQSLELTNLEFIPGLIQDTAFDACKVLGSIGLAHIDVVLYEPSVFAQNLALNYMTPGGYIVQDDALEPTCPGATLAVESLIRHSGLSVEQIWPQVIFRAPGLA